MKECHANNFFLKRIKALTKVPCQHRTIIFIKKIFHKKKFRQKLKKIFTKKISSSSSFPLQSKKSLFQISQTMPVLRTFGNHVAQRSTSPSLATQSANNHQDHQLIISNKTKANKQSTSAKSNLYYYHDQHSLHNNNDALQTTEHDEQYCTAQPLQSSSLNLHTNTINKSLPPSPPSHDSLKHMTFHSNSKKSTNHNHATSNTPNTIPSLSSSASHTLSTLNPNEFEIKTNKNFPNKKYQNGSNKSTKSLQKNDGNKFYDENSDKVDNNEFCDNYSDVLTSHYYLNKNDDRKGKKSKRQQKNSLALQIIYFFLSPSLCLFTHSIQFSLNPQKKNI